jgi:hypothetical protein
MKNLTTFMLALLYTLSAYSQKSEFTVYPNGLIYSEQTIQKLSLIVDSLNLKFKTCHFNTVFYSKQQAIGYLVTVDSSSIQDAKKDMESQMPIDQFIQKYPLATIQKDILILRHKYKNYENEDIVEIEHFDLKSDYGLSIMSNDLSLYQKDFSNQWYWQYSEKTSYSNEALFAFYFPMNFSYSAIPQKYSQMIGYSDCLIDTNTSKFKNKLKSGWVDLPKDWITMTEKEKTKLLEELRSTRVVGACSQDSRPRTHALNIALLSAETFHWEVFLKAHLDIMNDRFERTSDGSYAWGRRNTYIKELEELNINTSDLILGIIFRFENHAKNHYFASIGRVGRALSETTNREEIEKAMLSIISDNELDIYNRLLFYFLFKNYSYNLKDEVMKAESNEKLLIAVHTFPSFIQKQLSMK